MEMERANIVSKRCKGNMVDFINLQCLTGIREAIKNGDIPDWLLIEVFIRLSTKLLCRFKLVSKHWLSTISDPSFVRDYISRSSLVSQPWTFISHLMRHETAQWLHFLDHIYSQVTKPSYCVLPLPCTQQVNGGDEYFISGVSNGLVLYHSLSEKVLSYYICNPVTGHWISIPPLTLLQFHKGGCGFLTQVEDYALKSYRVVHLDWLIGIEISIRFDVFFSESGEWKNFTVSSDLEIWLSLDKKATTFNGILHWMAGGQCIIAYDPYKNPEEMRIIAFPDDIISQRRVGYYNLCASDACEGKFRFFQVSNMYIFGFQFPYFKLWVLNDYSSGDWCLQHSISYNDVQNDTNLSLKSLVRPIAFHPFNSDIVYLEYEDLIFIYNVKTTKLAVQQKVSTVQTFKQMAECPWSFLIVIPPWPMSI